MSNLYIKAATWILLPVQISFEPIGLSRDGLSGSIIHGLDLSSIVEFMLKHPVLPCFDSIDASNLDPIAAVTTDFVLDRLLC